MQSGNNNCIIYYLCNTHKRHVLRLLCPSYADKTHHLEAASLWIDSFWSLQSNVSLLSPTSQGCSLLCTDFQTRQRMWGSYSHPIIPLMHPIFGYITSNVLFHLSSLHFPILDNIPILCPSCPSCLTLLTVLTGPDVLLSPASVF